MEISYCEFCNDFVEYDKKLVKEKRIIERVGAKKNGYWKIIEKNFNKNL